MISFDNPSAKIIIGFLLYSNALNCVHGFSTFSLISNNPPAIVSSSILRSRSNPISPSSTSLYAQGKKKRRRRKVPNTTEAATPAPEVVPEPNEVIENVAPPAPEVVPEKESVEETPAASGAFKFDRDEAIALGITDAEDEDDLIPEFAPPKAKLGQGAVELPSFSDVVAKKKQKKDGKIDNDEDDEEEETEKIDRSDVSKFRQLLEIEPNADVDQSFFLQTEEYGTVSALLSEGAKPFLGIPSGPLQVGHFIGAGGIFLMAFVEYPGFPLTNLPGPLRGALQGGLGTIYLINAVLAGLSIFKAQERGQPPALWAAKTFSVGGLAFDQLTQIPTTKEVEARLAKKGKRALKKK